MENHLNKYVKIFIVIVLSLLLAACSGLFATDKSLSEGFRRDVGDRELSVYFNPMKDNITVALKNVGYSFMTNLTVAFECAQDNQTVTEMYTIGNLKSYFNKKLNVPISYYQCNKLTMKYSFIPMPDGGMGMDVDRNFIDPVNPVENTFNLK